MASLPAENPTTSFWHSEPSQFLLGHRTTSKLPEKVDVVIVGSGITGSSIARYLSEDEQGKDLNVLMLEAREACWGATGRNGGHCQPLLYDSSPDVSEFELRNVAAVKSYIENNNIACEWRSLPACRTFWTESLATKAQHDVQILKRNRPEIGQHVDILTDEQELLMKFRVNQPKCATITVEAGTLWPYKLVAFILEKLIKEGRLNLQTNTSVTKITQLPDQGPKERRYVLDTERGKVVSRHVILASNAYTSYLLPEFSDLIVPERGVMSALLPPKGSRRLQSSYGFVGALGANPTHDDYLNQRPVEGVPNASGHLMYGGGMAAGEFSAIGESDDSILDAGSAKFLRRALLRLMNLGGETEDLRELEASHQWSGIWGTSKDHHPWVGSVPGRLNVWLCGGYSGHGMPNATLCAKAVVRMVLGTETGTKHEDVTERLVRTGELPKTYVISKERMDRCKTIESVQAHNEKWQVSNEALNELMAPET